VLVNVRGLGLGGTARTGTIPVLNDAGVFRLRRDTLQRLVELSIDFVQDGGALLRGQFLLRMVYGWLQEASSRNVLVSLFCLLDSSEDHRVLRDAGVEVRFDNMNSPGTILGIHAVERGGFGLGSKGGLGRVRCRRGGFRLNLVG
jgi:hypothetical protein